MAVLTYLPQHETYAFICTFSEKDIAKANGFRWDEKLRLWVEPNPARAFRLIQYARPDTATKLKNSVGIDESILPFTKIIEPKGVKLYRHQKEAIEFILGRKNSYYAGDPGIGKTLTAIMAAETIQARSVVIICPPFLCLNWQNEIGKWTDKTALIVHTKGVNLEMIPQYQYYIVPDSVISRGNIRAAIMANKPDVMIIDETHRFKTETAARTQSVFGFKSYRNTVEPLVGSAKKVICLSGTPMPNRPVELWPVIKGLAHWCIEGKSFFEFVHRYCGAYKSEWGWDYTGATNVAELREKIIGKLMLRHEKMDFLDLPPKVVKFVELQPEKIINVELKKVAKLEDSTIEKLAQGRVDALGEMATVRRKIGCAKVIAAEEYIKEAILESGKVVIFCHHRSVIELLEAQLQNDGINFVSITGDVPMDKRQSFVDQFQTDPETKVFIGQIQAAGVGVTLTASRRVIFLESSWVPAENEQAADRCHRIGQSGSVLVEHLVFPHDLDYRILKANALKTKTINQLMKGV